MIVADIEKDFTASTRFRIGQVLKRALDLAISISGLLLIWPLFLVIGLAVKLDSPGPAFYKHHRIGKDGKPFDLYKFRSMICGGDDSNYLQYLKELIDSERDCDAAGLPYTKMDEDERITRVGRIIRKYYLDEIPQIINVLKGEMSLVGPRPHVQCEVENYTQEQRRRLTVKPGMTGLWQVAGKADCTFSQLIELDLEYIENWSLRLDWQILIKTAMLILQGGEGFWTRKCKEVPE